MIPVTTANRQKEKSPPGHSRNPQNSLSSRKQKINPSNYLEIIQRLRKQPNSLTQDDLYVLQKTIGNQAVIKLLSEIKKLPPKYIQAEEDKENTAGNKDSQQNLQQSDGNDKSTVKTGGNYISTDSANKTADTEQSEEITVNKELNKQTEASRDQKPDINKKDTDVESVKAENRKAAESASEKISQVSLNTVAKSEAGVQKTSQISKDNAANSETAAQKTTQASKANNAANSETAAQKTIQESKANNTANLESAAQKTTQASKANNAANSESAAQKTSQVNKGSTTNSEHTSEKNSQTSQKNVTHAEPAQTTAASGNKSASTASAQKTAAAGTKSAKQAVKAAPSVKITGDDPAKILNQMGNIPPTEIYDAFSQAASVSDGAFEKQREKAQATIPEIPAPTGLPPKKGGLVTKITQKVKEIKHKEPTNFRSEKTGGKAAVGIPADIKLNSDPEADADDVMAEARKYAQNTPSISLEGEADPGQMEGFEAEAAQDVSAAQQAELEQVNQDFGENSIAPQEDSTILKAKKAVAKVTPLGLSINRVEPIAPDVAAIANPQLSSELKGFMSGKENEFSQGKSQFDSGLADAKNTANAQIESEKAQARETQLREQANAKAEVEGYRNQWRTEINAVTAEYDKEAGAEVEKKKKEVGDIKREKEAEVKKTMSQAEKDADKECKSAKKEAEAKKQEGEKERSKNIFEKAWDWAKDKVEKAVDFVKKAVSSIFDKLRQAVKTIFEKAKQAALGFIEQGRKLIVGAIKGLGNILKGIVKKVFAKFPGISKRLCGLIDGAVDKATKAVNAAADKLKKGVTAALDFMAKTVDGLFSGLQNLYKSIMSGIKKFLSMDFRKIFDVVLEGAMIAAELAAAVVSGGGSVLAQIGFWLTTTLPKLIKQAAAVMNFVNTIRSIKISDVKQFLSPAGIGDFLVKGLFGQLKNLPPGTKGQGGKGAGIKQGVKRLSKGT